jgi:hypothetical protein
MIVALAILFCSFAEACKEWSLTLEKTTQFDEQKFRKSVKKIHIKPKEMKIYSKISDGEVRLMLGEFVTCGKNPMIYHALDEICSNIVGRTMFKVLMTKMIVQKSGLMKIVETHDPEEGSSYKNNVVHINPDFYESSGVGKPFRYYFYIDENGEIDMKLKSLAGSLFHEFCHALHDVSGCYRIGAKTTCSSEKIDGTWHEDEELRTITCFLDSNSGCHDPICDHCFDFCQSILKKEPFHPRYSHGGHNGKGQPKARDLQVLRACIPASQKYMDCCEEYVIP